MVSSRPEQLGGKLGIVVLGNDPGNFPITAFYDHAFSPTQLWDDKDNGYLPFPDIDFFDPEEEEVFAEGIQEIELDEMGSPVNSPTVLGVNDGTNTPTALKRIAAENPNTLCLHPPDSSINTGESKNHNWPELVHHSKYLVYSPGSKQMPLSKILEMGKIAFIAPRKSGKHWEEKLEPWVHFVPVKEDFSDLLSVHVRLESNQGLQKIISKAARDFTSKFLTLENQINNTIEALDKK